MINRIKTFVTTLKRSVRKLKIKDEKVTFVYDDLDKLQLVKKGGVCKICSSREKCELRPEIEPIIKEIIEFIDSRGFSVISVLRALPYIQTTLLVRINRNRDSFVLNLLNMLRPTFNIYAFLAKENILE